MTARRTRVDIAELSPEIVLDRLQFFAAAFDDIEKVRIANGNRLSAMTRSTTDTDGEMRGLGMSASHPHVAQMSDIVKAMEMIERGIGSQLTDTLKHHPLASWARGVRGVGDKQFARLLASIGDPYIRRAVVDEDGKELKPTGPRTVSQLWAYCGLHVVDVEGEDGVMRGQAPRRRRGVKANWSANAKTRVHLVATSCVKQLVKPCATVAVDPADDTAGTVTTHAEGECRCSPYRRTYDQRKAFTRANRPEWTDAHRHADALRILGKELLKDMWRAARDIHAPELAQREADAIIDGRGPERPRWLAPAAEEART